MSQKSTRYFILDQSHNLYVEILYRHTLKEALETFNEANVYVHRQGAKVRRVNYTFWNVAPWLDNARLMLVKDRLLVLSQSELKQILGVSRYLSLPEYNTQ